MKLDFEKMDGLIPVVIQDAVTRNVLMLGFMNEEAYNTTIESGRVTFFSRSKNRLWTKGETSGNFLDVVEVKADCDNDTLLIKANPKGPVCHTGADTCFDEDNTSSQIDFLDTLETIIKEREENPSDKSYTSSLFQKGINKIAQKVGEEAVELVIEAKDHEDDLFKNEAADLIFHLMVLFRAKHVTWNDVIEVLKKRHQTS